MNKIFFSALCVAVLAGNCLFIGHAAATEGYDVKKFGPQHPIIMEKPINVKFDHRVHTDQIGLACNECHDDLFNMQRGITPKIDQNMAALIKGKSCGACHDGDTAFASNTRCNACHIKPKDMKDSDPHPHGEAHGNH